MNTLIQQGCVKLIKSKIFVNVKQYFYELKDCKLM